MKILNISEFLRINETIDSNFIDMTPNIKTLIKTKKFKDWFGDWELPDSEHSLIVDAEGYPLLMYHGSNVKNIVNFEMNDGVIGKGAYFTSVFEEACDYVRMAFDDDDMDNDDCFEYVGCYFLNIRDENKIFNSNYGHGEICAMAVDNSEIMRVDL